MSDEDSEYVPVVAWKSLLTRINKPQRKMLRVIETIGTHPGKDMRVRRWHRYKVGMTLDECKMDHNMDHLDVFFHVRNGLMTLRDATDEEYKAFLVEWDSLDKARVAQIGVRV